MSEMIDRLWSDDVERQIEQAMDSMFPYGEGRTTPMRVHHHLEQVAQKAFQAGKSYALIGLMTAADVAEHFQISHRRACALIKHRHERFGVGMRFGNSWLVHRDDLPGLEPDARYRGGDEG